MPSGVRPRTGSALAFAGAVAFVAPPRPSDDSPPSAGASAAPRRWRRPEGILARSTAGDRCLRRDPLCGWPVTRGHAARASESANSESRAAPPAFALRLRNRSDASYECSEASQSADHACRASSESETRPVCSHASGAAAAFDVLCALALIRRRLVHASAALRRRPYGRGSRAHLPPRPASTLRRPPEALSQRRGPSLRSSARSPSRSAAALSSNPR